MRSDALLQTGRRPASEPLPLRNALCDWAHVPSQEMLAFGSADAPKVTIAIPTYRRHDLLRDAVKSAAEQELDGTFEIIVVDNDPESMGHERLLSQLPQLSKMNFRYIRNAENLGMYGNFNRAVEMARGEWLTLLHDDDLIDPDFVRKMLEQMKADPTIDGLVCQKRALDDRAVPYDERKLLRLARRALQFYQYPLRSTRRIDARKLFWGCVIGNTVGFLCRTEEVRALGGFYPEEHPSCDYFFYARFAQRYRLKESKLVLASVRIAANESLNKATQIACLTRNCELQQSYAGSVLPRYWARLIPLAMARQVANTSRIWRSDLDREEVGQQLGIALPPDRPLILLLLRALLRGF